MMKEITIIIPNYNGEDIIEKCINCLKFQNFKDFETLVIDDASTDNSIQILNNLPVKIIKNEINMGFAYSVNRGITEADSKFVLLLNNDVFIYDPDFLSSMLNTIKKDPSIFSVSSKMLEYKNPNIIDDTGDEYTIFGWVYKRGNGQKATQFSENSSVFSSCAGAGLYRKEIFDEIGYFDELHFAYLEDVDIGWRARINGYTNKYSAKSICYHLGSNTFAKGNKYSSTKVSMSARNNIYIIHKNMPGFQIVLNLPFLIIGFLIKTIYFFNQGFGKEYLNGLSEGLNTLKKLKRVPFKKSNIKNYKIIQREMVRSTITYVSLKVKQFSLKVRKKFNQKLEQLTEV